MEGGEFKENIMKGVERKGKAEEVFAGKLRGREGNKEVLTEEEEKGSQKGRAEGGR